MNALLGDTFSRENNTHGSRIHDRDPQFASRILGAMTQSCYIGTRDIRSPVIRGPYCITNDKSDVHGKSQGQRSKFKVTELKKSSNLTQIGRFWTVTPV